jgi:hypothetical protein
MVLLAVWTDAHGPVIKRLTGLKPKVFKPNVRHARLTRNFTSAIASSTMLSARRTTAGIFTAR